MHAMKCFFVYIGEQIQVNGYNKQTSCWLRVRNIFSLNDFCWEQKSAINHDNGQYSDDLQRPQNGKKNGNRPPDLEEIWHDFNRRLLRLFNRKKGRATGLGDRQPDNRRGTHISVGIISSILIAVYCSNGLFIVQQGQVGVVLRCGEYRYTALKGVHWRLPYPFGTHEIVNIMQIRSVEIGRNNVLRQTNVKDASMLTYDADIVDVRFIVQYKIRQPINYLFQNVNPEQSLTQVAQARVREIVGAHSTNHILYHDREAIRRQLVNAIQCSLDVYKTGLTLVGVIIQGVQLPDQVRSAIDNIAKAHQVREHVESVAQTYANELLPRAKIDAACMINDAKTYSDRVVAEAQGDAERFRQVYEQYVKAPAVIRERLYLETMQHIYSNTKKVFIDSKSGNNVIYLPLEKNVDQTLRSASEVALAPTLPSSTTEANAASGLASPVQESLSSREALRSRNRENNLQ